MQKKFCFLIGCIKACINYHAVAGLSQHAPLVLASAHAEDYSGPLIPDLAEKQAPSESTPQTSADVVPAVVEAVEKILGDSLSNLSFRSFQTMQVNTGGTRQISNVIVQPRRLVDFRRFMGDPRADFRYPEIAVLIERMQARQSHILAILPTGAGKTFITLFQAHTYDRTKVTIIISPLSSLLSDFSRRASDLHVSHSQWLPDGRFNPDVTVLFVSVEHASFISFTL